jgi:hypothetical protein
MDGSTEPDVPILAPLPKPTQRSLLEFAKADWPLLNQPGLKVHIEATHAGDVQIAAIITVRDFSGMVVGRRSVTGWSVGAGFQWSF